MIGLSTVFYCRLLKPNLVPSTYADNWSWLTTDERAMFAAFTSLLNLVTSLRMQVDIKKSWVWATDKSAHQGLRHLNLLFPSGEQTLEIKTSSLDLGEIIQYGKKWIIGPLAERALAAVQRIQKLQWIPLTIDEKCQRIQAAGWAFGLYGADSHILGSQHFQKLRRAVVVAVVGNYRLANPMLAHLVLSKFLQDPMVWVLCNLFCTIRRIANQDRSLAVAFLTFAQHLDISKPFGPASSMLCYLRPLGWQVTPDGIVKISPLLSFNCLCDSAKFIRSQICLGWNDYAIAQCAHRRGIQDQFLDIPTTRSIFSRLDESQKRTIILNMVGGFQSEFSKAKWACDADQKCMLCGQTDHLDHRMLYCPKLEAIREQFHDVVGFIKESRMSWIYHPTRSIFSRLDESQKRTIILNMVGGFQSEFSKAKWACDADQKCMLCGQTDHLDHRMLYCPKLEAIREQFHDVVGFIKESRMSWIYHPFAHQFPHLPVLQAFLQSIGSITDQVSISSDSETLRFYTDGGCDDPTEIDFRHGSWSVVLDKTNSDLERQNHAAAISPLTLNSPLFECVATGHVAGQQPASRGELQACVVACRAANGVQSCTKVDIFTDSQYVINMSEAIAKDMIRHRLDKVANSDLVALLAKELSCKIFSFHKVKSHRHASEAVDYDDLWSIVGNHLADVACSLSLKRIPKEILDLLHAAREHRKTERRFLEKMLHFATAINRSRAQQLAKTEKPSEGHDENSSHVADGEQQHEAVGNQALVILQNFSLTYGETFVQVELSPQLALASLQGVRLAHAIWLWVSSLKWSTNEQQEGSSAIKWGISWLELYFNFHVTTGMTFPIKVEGQNKKVQYLNYFSPECRMLPDKLRSVGNQMLLLQYAIRQLENLTQIKTMPPSMRWGCVSLKRLFGFLGKSAGVGTRPVMQQQHQTLQRVQQYMLLLKGARTFWHDLPENFSTPCFFVSDDIHDIPYEQRIIHYQRLRRARGWVSTVFAVDSWIFTLSLVSLRNSPIC